MATQASLLGFASYTVDAISWTAIYPRYAYRSDGEAVIENGGDVTVNLRTASADSATERPLLSGERMSFKTGGPRGVLFAPQIPICYVKAASGTATFRVIEQ